MTNTLGKFSLWATEVFVASVEEGTISGAATRLKASNSTVSQQLTNLEANLGVDLLDRSTRPMRLTSEGQIFLRRARNILAEANQVRMELSEFDSTRVLRLRIGVIDDFDADVTPAMITKLSAKMPNCQFLLESGSSLGMMSDLKSQSIDIAISADVGKEADWMDIYPLMQEPFVVVAPKGAVDKTQDIMAQLSQIPFIRYSSRELMGRQIEAHLARQRIALPNRFEINNYHAILSLIADGAGWTITTPMGFLRARRFASDVDLLTLPMEPMSRRISLVARKDTMGTVPKEILDLLRPLIQTHVIDALPMDIKALKKDFCLIS